MSRVEKGTSSVGKAQLVLQLGELDPGIVQEAQESPFENRVRQCRAAVEDDRHRPDAAAAAFADFSVPIGDCDSSGCLIAFSAVERFLDTLPAVDRAEVDERPTWCRHRDRTNVATILRFEIERLVDNRKPSSIAHRSGHGDLDRSRREPVEPVQCGRGSVRSDTLFASAQACSEYPLMPRRRAARDSVEAGAKALELAVRHSRLQHSISHVAGVRLSATEHAELRAREYSEFVHGFSPASCRGEVRRPYDEGETRA